MWNMLKDVIEGQKRHGLGWGNEAVVGVVRVLWGCKKDDKSHHKTMGLAEWMELDWLKRVCSRWWRWDPQEPDGYITREDEEYRESLGNVSQLVPWSWEASYISAYFQCFKWFLHLYAESSLLVCFCPSCCYWGLGAFSSLFFVLISYISVRPFLTFLN